MSVIQKIRDKYAVVIVVVICVAIVSFLLQDAFFGRNSLFRRSTTVGEVNGQELDVADYQQRIQAEENGMRQQMPNGNIDDQTRQYIRERVWNQFLNEQIMQVQYDKLGISVTEAEVKDLIFGKNPILLLYNNSPIRRPANMTLPWFSRLLRTLDRIKAAKCAKRC